MKLSAIAMFDYGGETLIDLIAEYRCFEWHGSLLYSTSEVKDIDWFMFCHWGLEYGVKSD